MAILAAPTAGARVLVRAGVPVRARVPEISWNCQDVKKRTLGVGDLSTAGRVLVKYSLSLSLASQATLKIDLLASLVPHLF